MSLRRLAPALLSFSSLANHCSRLPAVLGLLAVLCHAAVAQETETVQVEPARTDGTVLTYDLTGHGDPEDLLERLRHVHTELVAGLRPGVQLKLVQHRERRSRTIRAEADDPGHVETENVVTAAFMLSSEDPRALEQIESAVAVALPDLPAPSRTSASWLGEGILERGITVNLAVGTQTRQFVFPLDVSEGEVRDTLTQWLVEQEPHLVHNVEVTITGSNTQRQVQVRIESVRQAND